MRFTDVPDDYWAAGYIYEMVQRGIVSGYGDGTFGPLNSVLRCEYAKMLVELADIPVGTGTSTPFVDVDVNQWYFPYVKAIQPYSPGFEYYNQFWFFPESPATREDFTVALMKVLNLDLSAYYNDLSTVLSDKFPDYESVASYNRPYVAAAVDLGYISGHQDGEFKGQDFISRSEVSAILCRVYGGEE